MIPAVLLWQSILNLAYFQWKKRVSYTTCGIAKFASEPFYLCTFSSGFPGQLCFFYAHTVTVLISQLFSRQTATYQCRRGVSFMIFLQHTDQNNADGNSHLATRLHTLCTYLCIKPKQTLTRRERENIIPSKPYGHQERSITKVCTIWPGGKHYVGGAATQLLCITAVCTYQLMSDYRYIHKQQTSPRRG